MKVRDGQAIRRWRLQAGFTQDELASLCKCSQTTVHMIEAGKLTSITDALARTIARRLHVPWEDLFEARGDVPVPDKVHGARTGRRRAAA